MLVWHKLFGKTQFHHWNELHHVIVFSRQNQIENCCVFKNGIALMKSETMFASTLDMISQSKKPPTVKCKWLSVCWCSTNLSDRSQAKHFKNGNSLTGNVAPGFPQFGRNFWFQFISQNHLTGLWIRTINSIQCFDD